MSVTYGGDVITFADSSTIGSGVTHFKNRIINGDMRVSQRYGIGGQLSLSANSYAYVLDRHYQQNYGSGMITVYQSSDVPTPFANALAVQVSTAQSTYNTNDVHETVHIIEATNVTDLEWGTATAKSVAISFWVKSAATGNYNLSIQTNGTFGTATDSYCTYYTVNNPNAWEYKTIVVPGPTSGANWTTLKGTNQGYLQLRFLLDTGSGRTGSTSNQWVTGNIIKTSDTPNRASFMSGAGNIWKITGLQLEVGSTATTFERRDITMETLMCQRYYVAYRNPTSWPGYQDSTDKFTGNVTTPVPMRTLPGIVVNGGFYIWRHNGYQQLIPPTITMQNQSQNTYYVTFGGFSGGVNGYVATGYAASMNVSAELA